MWDSSTMSIKTKHQPTKHSNFLIFILAHFSRVVSLLWGSRVARVCGCTPQQPAIMRNQCHTPSFFSYQASILSFFGMGSNAPPSRPSGSVTAKQPGARKRTPQDSKSSSSQDKDEERATTDTSQAAKRRRKKEANRGGGALDSPGIGGSAAASAADQACGELVQGRGSDWDRL